MGYREHQRRKSEPAEVTAERDRIINRLRLRAWMRCVDGGGIARYRRLMEHADTIDLGDE